MSAQTPQTDAARILWRDIGKPLSPDASTNADYGYYVSAQLFRTLEADRDRLKALCEELREALRPLVALRLSHEPTISDALYRTPSEQLRRRATEIERRDAEILLARAALKKAEKP